MDLLKTSLVICTFFIAIIAQAQLNQGGIPPSFEKSLFLTPIDFHTIQAIQTEKLKQEDLSFDTIPEIPWRFGENIPTNITPANSGTWHKTATGDNIWQTGIYSPGAISINLVFHPYHLPPGAKLFVYSANKKEMLGAFDHRNNQDDKFFATSLIFSDSIIVEYFEPSNVPFKGEVAVSQVTHGYRNARILADKVFGDSGDCNINVACDVAQPFADQARAVALLLVGSNSFCTGALINNAENDGTPYILSANHCYRDPSTLVFWFNWESETCEDPVTAPEAQVLSGAQPIARYIYNNTTKTGSDFWLMEMNHLPPFEYNLFYMGWNRTNDPLTIDSVVGIHHPSGDIKKFSWSTDSIQLWGYGSSNAGYDTHWRVKSWDAGTTTEGGSSGSPLLDHQGRIIGQLHGGAAACGNTLPDWYGRLAVSWDGGETDATRLKTWLDPNGLNPETNNGYQPVYYFIESSVGGNGGGAIDPSFHVMENRDYTFQMVPDIGYSIMDVLVDGESVGPASSYTFENVSQPHTIEAIFGIPAFTLTATAGENGIIAPSGEILVEINSSRTFNITPDSGYHVNDVMVDGESVGAVASYTFENITQDHTIHATFANNTYTLTATAGLNGMIDPTGETVVVHNASQTFTITPDAGYHIEDVLVDDESVGTVTSYTFENIAQDHTIQATFAINTYTITATAGENGIIDPAGETVVVHNASQTFTITPDAGYHIEDVLVDDESVGTVTSYTFENITQDHTIQATFAINTYTITATAGENGIIDPAGETVVVYNASQTFTITPDAGYHIEDVLVDDESVGTVTSYTFENITQDHTIHATFAINTYTLTATAGENGIIDPAGETVVEYGSSQTFTITPDTGYYIEDVLVDDESVGTVTSYTFENITQDHTIHATFAINTYTLTATAGENGIIDPAGETIVEHGSSQTFTITPDSGYQIAEVLVDGINAGLITSFTFDDIQSDHTLEASFYMPAFVVVFNITDENDQPITDAIAELNGIGNEPGNYSFDGLIAGTYPYTITKEGYFPGQGDVTLTDQDIMETVVMQIDDTSLAKWEAGNKNSLHIYPNPAQSQLNIKSGLNITRVQLFNVTGATVREINPLQNELVINISYLQPGLYVLRVQTNKGSHEQKIQIIR